MSDETTNHPIFMENYRFISLKLNIFIDSSDFLASNGQNSMLHAHWTATLDLWYRHVSNSVVFDGMVSLKFDRRHLPFQICRFNREHLCIESTFVTCHEIIPNLVKPKLKQYYNFTCRPLFNWTDDTLNSGIVCVIQPYECLHTFNCAKIQKRIQHLTNENEHWALKIHGMQKRELEMHIRSYVLFSLVFRFSLPNVLNIRYSQFTNCSFDRRWANDSFLTWSDRNSFISNLISS